MKTQRIKTYPILALTFALLTACGGGGGGAGGGGGNGGDGGGGGGGDIPTEVPTVPVGLTAYYGAKAYAFSWMPSASAARYEVKEDPDGPGPEPERVLGETAAASYVFHLDALLDQRLAAEYAVRSCNAAGCSAWSTSVQPSAAQAIGYVKAGEIDDFDRFGYAVAISADGKTMVVGMPLEDGAATTIDGEVNDNASDAGAAYVYVRTSQGWQQHAYLKADNAQDADEFGFSVAVSADGNTVAVGAPLEDGGDGPTGTNSGAVYVFGRAGASWSQHARVKASNAGVFDNFGFAVALSADGSTLAVGARSESGDNDSKPGSGAAYVFVRSGITWSEQARLKASDAAGSEFLGTSVALSADGKVLAAGAPRANGNAPQSGAVYVFAHNGTSWTEQFKVKANIADTDDSFGSAIAMSADGNTLAVGAPFEDGNIGDPENDGLDASGAAYVFTRDGSTWVQKSYLKASNSEQKDYFGLSVSLSADGSLLVVGAPGERSNASGINGNQSNNADERRGAAYLFARGDTSWMQRSYLKSSNSGAFQDFGHSVAIAGNRSILAVGAVSEAGGSTGIQRDQEAQNSPSAGAVYLY